MKIKTEIPILMLSISLFGSLVLRAQNLVPNPSFEDYKKLDCETIGFRHIFNGSEQQKTFDSLLYYWTAPVASGGVELYSELVSSQCYKNTTNCLSPDCTTNPISVGGSPKDGNNMIGLYGVNYYKSKQNERSYIQAPLKNPLSAGASYLAGCYTMLPTYYYGEFASNNLGMLFSSGAVTATSQSLIIKSYPQVNQTEVNKDHGIWKKLYGCFTAKGDERYLTIGNFYDDDHTKVELIVDHYDQGDDFSNYLIDSVFTEEIGEPFIPNVITPNGDLLNDKFVVKNILFGWWQLDVYNRWGKLVYHSTDYRNNWDGDNLGDGVYYYDLRHRCPGISYKGSLTICR